MFLILGNAVFLNILSTLCYGTPESLSSGPRLVVISR